MAGDHGALAVKAGLAGGLVAAEFAISLSKNLPPARPWLPACSLGSRSLHQPRISRHRVRQRFSAPERIRAGVNRGLDSSMNGRQFIYHMEGLTKTYPGGKKVLENIRSVVLPGAKIGVVGVNGSGKSTLLRIMAGIDKDFTGEAWAAEGVSVGYLEQEPELDPRSRRPRQRHGRRRRQEGAPRPLQRDRRQLFGRDRRRDGEAAGPDRRPEPVGPRQPGRRGDGRPALPARRRRRRQALRRRAAPRRAVQAAARPARHAAARRADQPPRRRDRRLAAKAT